MRISEDLAAQVLFLSDRTCCVCKTVGRSVQIHHIDGNPNNNDIDNLAVLCLDCHNETQLSGGFGRKLTPWLVKIYRNDWTNIISARRETKFLKELINGFPESDSKVKNLLNFLERSLKRVDYLYEHKNWYSLAFEFKMLGQIKLARKYAKREFDDRVRHQNWVSAAEWQILFFDPDEIDTAVLKKAIDVMLDNKDYSQLARIYDHLGKQELASIYYIKAVNEFIDNEEWFTAAFYLKESGNEKSAVPLFRKALRKALEENEIHLIVRCYEELGDHQTLEAYAKEVLETYDLDKISKNTLLSLLRATGKEKEADDLFDRIVTEGSQNKE